MDDKRVSPGQDILWRLEALGFDLFTAFFRALPVDLASWLGGAICRLLGPLTPSHAVARRNLELAFPEKDAAWHKEMLDKQWESVGRGFAEFPLLDRLRVGNGRVEVVNAERLAEIAAGGQPAVFVSGHLSTFEVMPACILEAGIPCEITYRAANNPYVDDRIKKSRRRYGVELFAPKGGDGAKELLEGLKAGKSVALMNDQKFNNGVEAPFFGHLCHTAPGPSRLALRFGAPLQPMSVTRTKGARFRVIVHDPIHLPKTGDRQADIENGVRLVNAFMEDRIREHPEEWFWVHRRWPKSMYK